MKPFPKVTNNIVATVIIIIIVIFALFLILSQSQVVASFGKKVPTER